MRSTGRTIWTTRKTERRVLVKRDKSTSAFFSKMEERRDGRAHKLADGEVFVAEVVSHQSSLKD